MTTSTIERSRDSLIADFVEATRMHNNTALKSWAKESDRLAKLAKYHGVTDLELMNAWLEI